MFRIATFLGVGALLFWLAIKGQNVDVIRENLRQADWKWAALSLLLAVISNVVRAARWNLLIHPLGYRPRLLNTIGAVVIGYLANLALPRLGEVARCATLHRHEAIPISKLLGTVVVERIIDVLMLFALLGTVVLLAADQLRAFGVQHVIIPLGERWRALLPYAGLPYVIIVAACAGALWLAWFLFFRRREAPLGLRTHDTVRGFTTGLGTVGRLHDRARFALYTLLIWALYLMMSYTSFLCLQATSNLGLVAALAVMVFGGFGWAAPVQGGLGTFDVIVTQTLVMFGVGASAGLAYAILAHATQVFGMLTFGLIGLVSLPAINRR